MRSIVISLFIFAGLIFQSKSETTREIDVRMPDVSPHMKDSYLCFQKKIDGEEPFYIRKFIPHSSANIAHHILLYACETPGSYDEVWGCGEMANSGSNKNQWSHGPICNGKQKIIYAWAKDAPQLELPDDVAFKVGPRSDSTYLVMQVHYADVKKFEDGRTDKSGITVVGQSEQVKYPAGVYFSATAGHINAHSFENFEAACEITEDVEMVPFAYRTHAHKLGLVNTGYLIRNDPIIGDKAQTWTEIGRRSPQLPQMFFPISNDITIKKGDIIASRCTMENTRDNRVYIGATGDDEMCNFYIMYYLKTSNSLKNNVCYTNGPPYWDFNNFIDTKGNVLKQSEIPADISEIPANQIKELKAEHKKMSKMDMDMNDNQESSNYYDEPSKQRLVHYLTEILRQEYEQ